jgi:16S rRNA (guanine527-N7)-methyltransferase
VTARDDDRELVEHRIRELGERYALTPKARGQLATLLWTLAADPLAPTTVTDPRRALEDHVADSLVALELEAASAAVEIADLGAGAGFPGLVLAIARPLAHVSLVESSNRKCEFIVNAARVSSIANATAIHTRAEAWPEGHERFDLVTARALAPLPVVAEYAAPLLKIGGTLVVWRGKREPSEEQAAARAAAELGLEPAEPLEVKPYPQARNRHLHALLKVGSTPPRFPRRPGVARKRPLGRSREQAGSRAAPSDREQR